MRILGLDLSLTATGYCVIGAAPIPIIMEKGIIKTGVLRDAARLNFILERTDKLLKTYNPDRIAIEGYSFASRFSHAHSLGELGGCIKVMLFRQQRAFHVLPPTHIKKYVTGRGNAKKNEMLLAIYKKWGVEFTDDNEADAYALARMLLEKNS